MKSRTRMLIVAVLAAGVVALAMWSAPGAEAARPYSERSLRGFYHFTVIEIRLGPVYCNAYGLIQFDGQGGAEIKQEWGYGVCSDGDMPVEDGLFDYTVSPGGSVVLTELGTGNDYVTHCQIVDSGRMLLCDGTGGGPGAVLPADQLLWYATARKL